MHCEGDTVAILGASSNSAAVRRASTSRAFRASLALLGTVAILATACQPPVPAPANAARSCSVGIVGDSLAVGSSPFWEQAFNSRGCRIEFVNARGGRPTSEGQAVIEMLAAAGRLPDILVVALGTNDRIDPRHFAPKVQRIMNVAGDRPVVWVNVDKPFVETTINLTLRIANLRYDNLWVYDWNWFADRAPQIRLSDNIHLTEGGYNLRAALIAWYVTGR